MKKVLALVLALMMLVAGSALADANNSTVEYININSDYKEYARNPDAHHGELIEFTGEVIQVIEDSSETQYRVAVNGDSDEIFFVSYSRKTGEGRILEDDQVVVQGVCLGTITYESTMGGRITIPACSANSIALYDSTVDAATDASEGDEKFPAVGYTYATKKYYFVFLEIENKSGRDTKIEVLIKYFDENGELVGITNTDESAFEKDTKILLQVSNDLPFATYEYEIVAKDDKYYTGVDSALEVKSNTAKNKVIVSVTNNGTKAAKYVYCNILFLKNGVVVGWDSGYMTDSDSMIKPGKSEYAEFKCSEEFDDVRVYVHGLGEK